MLSITGTPDSTPKDGGDSFNLLTILLQARKAADVCSSHAKQAEQSRNAFLAGFFNEIGDIQMEVVRRTQVAIERLSKDSQKADFEKAVAITTEPKTANRKEAGRKKKAT